MSTGKYCASLMYFIYVDDMLLYKNGNKMSLQLDNIP